MTKDLLQREAELADRELVLNIREAVFDGAGIRKIAALISEVLNASVFILDTGYRLIAMAEASSCEPETRPYVERIISELKESSSLSIETVVSTEKDQARIFAANGIIARNVYTDGFLTARMFLVIPANVAPDRRLDALASEAALCLEKHFSSSGYEPESHRLAARFIADLKEAKTQNEKSIRRQASSMKIALPRYYSCLLVKLPENSGVKPVNQMMSGIRTVFPGAIISYSAGSFTCIIPSEVSGPDNAEKLNTLLKQLSARAGQSYISHYYASFSENIKEAENAIAFGQMVGDGASRITRFEEISTYVIIDLCRRAIGTDIPKRSMVHLCSPLYLSLLRHDREKGDDLCHVLEVYLKNNCSQSRAAAELFIHRNTLTGKLERIKNITRSDLSDSQQRLNLILSAMIVRYMDKILGEDIEDHRRRYGVLEI